MVGTEGSACGFEAICAAPEMGGFGFEFGTAVDPLLLSSLSSGTAKFFSDLRDRRRQSWSCLGDVLVSGAGECVSAGEWTACVWSFRPTGGVGDR